jgi:hypothetical protein
MANLSRLMPAAKFRIKRAILAANYRLGNYRDRLWLIGDGRSGTTWAANLLNHRGRYRQLFEPFHPQMVSAASFLRPQLYVRPDKAEERLQAFATEVFSGRFAHPHVDSANRALVYRGLLVKDIFAHLFAYWASLRFPEVRTLLLIRNPFAVALSKRRRQDWFWLTEPMDLLAQPDLHEDFLGPFEDIICETSRKRNFFLNQILIWAVINYIPLRQFQPERLHVAFYEDVYANPNQAIGAMLRFALPARAEPDLDMDSSIVNRLSWVSGANSTIRQGRSPVTSWKDELDRSEIDSGRQILQRFGMAGLYGDDGRPDSSVLRTLRTSPH